MARQQRLGRSCDGTGFRRTLRRVRRIRSSAVTGHSGSSTISTGDGAERQTRREWRWKKRVSGGSADSRLPLHDSRKVRGGNDGNGRISGGGERSAHSVNSGCENIESNGGGACGSIDGADVEPSGASDDLGGGPAAESDPAADAPAVAVVASAVASAVASPLRGPPQGEATSPSNLRATSVLASSSRREATSAVSATLASGTTTNANATSVPHATSVTAAKATPCATAAAASHADFIIRAVAPSAGVALWEALRRATDAATAVASLHTWQEEDCADVDEGCSREFWAAVAADDAAEEDDWILAVDSLGLWWLFGHSGINISDNEALTSSEEDISNVNLNKEYNSEIPGNGVDDEGVIVTEAAGAEQLEQQEQREQRGQQDGCTPDMHKHERPEGCYSVRVFVSEFEARAPFLHFSLSEHAARVASSPNAGGASVISESLSVEYFVRHFGATDIISEMEIKYCHSNWKKVDYICSLFGRRFGVSVTRAMMYPDPALFDCHRARALLRKKLHGLVVAWSGISPMHSFSRAILHIWCETPHIANLLHQAFPSVCRELDLQEDLVDLVLHRGLSSRRAGANSEWGPYALGAVDDGDEDEAVTMVDGDADETVGEKGNSGGDKRQRQQQQLLWPPQAQPHQTLLPQVVLPASLDSAGIAAGNAALDAGGGALQHGVQTQISQPQPFQPQQFPEQQEQQQQRDVFTFRAAEASPAAQSAAMDCYSPTKLIRTKSLSFHPPATTFNPLPFRDLTLPAYSLISSPHSPSRSPPRGVSPSSAEPMSADAFSAAPFGSPYHPSPSVSATFPASSPTSPFPAPSCTGSCFFPSAGTPPPPPPPHPLPPPLPPTLPFPPPRQVDCRRMNPPLGRLISRLCGFQSGIMQRRQHVFVMHHGERADAADPLWARREGAERAWDPPLSEWGKYQAYEVGMRLRQEGWGVTRIVCAPYLRCVETALELLLALTDAQPLPPPSSSAPTAASPAGAPTTAGSAADTATAAGGSSGGSFGAGSSRISSMVPGGSSFLSSFFSSRFRRSKLGGRPAITASAAAAAVGNAAGSAGSAGSAGGVSRSASARHQHLMRRRQQSSLAPQPSLALPPDRKRKFGMWDGALQGAGGVGGEVRVAVHYGLHEVVRQGDGGAGTSAAGAPAAAAAAVELFAQSGEMRGGMGMGGGQTREGVGQGIWRVQSAVGGQGQERGEGQDHGQEQRQGQGQGQNQGPYTVAANTSSSAAASSLAPRDWLEGMFPPGSVDRILPVVAGSATAAADVALPGWPEDVEEAALRLLRSIDHVAEQWQDENIIVVSDSDAVHASILRGRKHATVHNILTAGYVHTQRNVYRDQEDEEERGVGQWQLASRSGSTGIFFN
ncbi:unnamed protein product [Closterium sp. Yama58-4]|nr:unnamed protein product [Closterium sp. Yama58-4]